MRLSDLNLTEDLDLTSNKVEVVEDEYNRFNDMLSDMEKESSEELSTEYRGHKTLQSNTLLIIEIGNNLELEFLSTLLKPNIANCGLVGIEVCVPVDNVLARTGYMEFCFENIMRILSYNRDIKMSLKPVGSEAIPLTTKMILNLM